MGTFKVLKVENRDITTNLTEQIYFEVKERDKFEALCRVLDFEQEFYGIIFCRTKMEVDEVTKQYEQKVAELEIENQKLAGDTNDKVINSKIFLLKDEVEFLKKVVTIVKEFKS
jgi:superfamily II DNA/RNA helicase